MDELKKSEVKDKIKTNWKGSDKTKKIKVAKDLHDGYIFGKYANNEHYNIDEFTELTNDKDSEETAIFVEIDSKMKGEFEVSEGVFYVVTTQQSLIDSINSEWGDVSDTLEELMDGKNWTAFKNSY